MPPRLLRHRSRHTDAPPEPRPERPAPAEAAGSDLGPSLPAGSFAAPFAHASSITSPQPMRLGQVLEAARHNRKPKRPRLMWTAGKNRVLCLLINIVQISPFRKRKSRMHSYFVNYDKILCKQYYVNQTEPSAKAWRFNGFPGIFCGLPPVCPPHLGREAITACNHLSPLLRVHFCGN